MTSRKKYNNGIDICPKCGFDKIFCTNTDSTKYGRKRSKHCGKCLNKFQTMEIISINGAPEYIALVKKLVRDIEDISMKTLLEVTMKKYSDKDV